MGFVFQDRVLSLSILLLVLWTPCSHASRKPKTKVKTAVFLSPKFEMGPGSAVNEIFHDIEFPKGHIALKGFNAELVDEEGIPVPLHETYVHHWLIGRFNQNIHNTTDREFVRNAGICQDYQGGQLFGLGSEARGTPTDVPDPFGIEVGNPPEGYEESWMLNVHAIDTRGVVDIFGCAECKCDLFNGTKKPLKPNYFGGLHCCPNGSQCRVKQGFKGGKRSLYMRYTVKWVEWSDHVVPLKVYIFDVTDALEMPNCTNGLIQPRHNCMDEYDVEPCKNSGEDGHGCIDVKRQSLPIKTGGYVIYGAAHQHARGAGSTLYGEDGRVICTSKPKYGKGKKAGDEKGYIVGMSTCYPQPGTVEIISGEVLTLESNYSSSRYHHTGVMGLFYVMVAEDLPESPLKSSFG